MSAHRRTVESARGRHQVPSEVSLDLHHSASVSESAEIFLFSSFIIPSIII